MKNINKIKILDIMTLIIEFQLRLHKLLLINIFLYEY